MDGEDRKGGREVDNRETVPERRKNGEETS
jgi:hypothetical protein